LPTRRGFLVQCAAFLAAEAVAGAQAPADLDARVSRFLDGYRDAWHDLNVPEIDGRTLHDLVLSHRYTRALEIGTSTGRSGTWLAWALSKTGGRLTTIEIDEERHRTALANFREAGVDRYVDARLGNAHEIVPGLAGPFDFVFSDADKDWYANYLHALWPKLSVGGCFTAHNVLNTNLSGISEFLDALTQLTGARTTIDKSSSSGLSITYKLA
jgi:predicted O-methyltransferase YrrM